MKTRILISLISALIYSGISNAQWINTLTVVPSNPSATDTVYVYAQCSFPSGTCDQHAQYLYADTANVYAAAIHCLGMLAVICDNTDTFKIPPLPAGNYTFIFNVSAGSLPSPCTPGIAPGATDSISFSVSASSGIPHTEKNKFDFNIVPNPSSGWVKVEMNEALSSVKNKFLIICSFTGQEVKRNAILNSTVVDVSQLPAGLYYIRIIGNDFISTQQKMEIIK